VRRWPSVLTVVALSISALGVSSPSAGAKTSSGPEKPGGTVTITLPGITWPTLDPATSSVSELDGSILYAIFGALIEVGPHSTLVPDEATGWHFSNHGLNFDLTIRRGQRFQDGTPFDAAAVADSMKRDLTPSTGCECLADFGDVTSVSAPSQYDVRLTLRTPDYALPADFIDDPMNWTVSPSALQKGASGFAQHPVGAGPFEVVSNAASNVLTLRRYPGYWESGHPYLSGLKFISTTADASDLDALESNSAQVTSVTTVPVWRQAQAAPGLKTYEQQGSTIAFLRINTKTAPFDKLLAREAVAYATNPATIDAALYKNVFQLIQGFTSPYMLFFQKHVPNYPKYNLAKAKSLVQQLGGLQFTVIVNTTPIAEEQASALAAQWKAAGMTVTISPQQIPAQAQDLQRNNWQIMASGWAGCDVDPGDCAPINFASTGYWSGVKDPALDHLIDKAAGSPSPAVRRGYYDQINAYLNSHFYYTWLWAQPALMIARTNVEGLPTSVGLDGPFNWENVWVK
jgi:peptide/nickel transport system substrate-binding protein